MTDSDLIFNCLYFFVSEIMPSLFACFVLRNRIFSEEHDMLLERSLLPQGMEIDPDEVVLEEPVGAGAYGTVYAGSFRAMRVAVKQFHVRIESPGMDRARDTSQVSVHELLCLVSLGVYQNTIFIYYQILHVDMNLFYMDSFSVSHSLFLLFFLIAARDW